MTKRELVESLDNYFGDVRIYTYNSEFDLYSEVTLVTLEDVVPDGGDFISARLPKDITRSKKVLVIK